MTDVRQTPSAKMPPLGVFLASADMAQNAALRLVFEQQQGVRIVGCAVNTQGVLDAIQESGADFLLLDWELPVQSALLPLNGEGPPELAVPELVARLRKGARALRIVVLTIKPEIEPAAIDAGANVVMAKTGPPERMLAILRAQIKNNRAELYS
jgi:DNA-binding NarL/FixJ family response regulator